jgi:hypothetical protein
MTYVIINTFFILFDFVASNAGACRRPGCRIVDAAVAAATRVKRGFRAKQGLNDKKK